MLVRMVSFGLGLGFILEYGWKTRCGFPVPIALLSGAPEIKS